MKTLQPPMPVGVSIPAILTKKQAAAYVQASTWYLERQIRAGRLKALRLSGKFIRIRRSDLDAFLESGSTIGGDE